MTTEIEKTFFDTFGIEQKEHKECQCDYLNCPNPDIEECEECYYYKTYKFDYPQITDRHYLELIILVNSPYYEIEYVYTDVKDLKVSILEQAIKCYKNDKLFAKHIQALFEEG